MEMSLNMKNMGIRLPNGKIQVTQSEDPSLKGRIFETAEEFNDAFQAINESGENKVNCIILDNINEG